MANVAASSATMIVAGRGWSDKREVRVGNISASWRVNGIGRLSALIPVRDAWAQGIDDYTDQFVYWRHPTMGVWVGVIKQTRVRGGQTVEVSARSLVRRLRKSRVIRTYHQQRASAGALVFRALQDSNGELALFDRIEIDDAGPLISVEWRADDRFQILDRLAQASGQQYRVDFDDNWKATLQFRQRVGEDKSGSVLLMEGYNAAEVEIVTDADNVENDILAVSADDDWPDAAFVYVRDGESIQDRGRQQGVRRYYGVTSPGALADRARVELRESRNPTIAVSVRMSARDVILNEIQEGDRVRLWSASANRRYLFDVEQRAINDATGVAALVGTAEEE